MKILSIIVVLLLSSCSVYKCGNKTKQFNQEPGMSALFMPLDPVAPVIMLGEALMCPEEK